MALVNVLTTLAGNEILQVLPVQSNGHPAAETAQTTTSAIAALASVGGTPTAVNTNITTVGAGTLTAAALVGRVITRSGPTSAFTDTTDTAANIIAALPALAVIGESFVVTSINTTAYPQTITAGSGVTLTGLANPVAANSTGYFLLTYTGAGAVSLQLVSVAYNSVGGFDPSTVLTQFGSGTGTFLEEGNLSRQISAAGVSPGATGVDSVLAVFSVPASSFDILGRGISVTAQGSFAATGNNKRIKIIWNPSTAVVGSTVGTGGTTFCDTGTVTTSGTGWSVQGNVFKYGASGSNTQICLHQQAQVGPAVASMLSPSLATATENGAILIAVTGNATTATSDIVFNFLEVNAMN